MPNAVALDYPIRMSWNLNYNFPGKDGDDRGLRVDIKGRYLAWAKFDENDDGSLSVIDLGEDLGFDGSETPVVLWSGNANMRGMVLGEWGVAYTVCSGPLFSEVCDLNLHFFGPDGVPEDPATGDDQLVTTDPGGLFDGDYFMWTAPGYYITPGEVSLSGFEVKFYDVNDIQTYGDNWKDNIQPNFSLKQTGRMEDADVSGYSLFISAKTGASQYQVRTLSGTQIETASSQPVESGLYLETEPDYHTLSSLGANFSTQAQVISRDKGSVEIACQGGGIDHICYLSRQWGEYIVTHVFDFLTYTSFFKLWHPQTKTSLDVTNMTPEPPTESDNGLRWFVTDGNKMLYNARLDEVPGQVIVHLYDLGSDGLHQEDNSVADPGLDPVQPFPVSIAGSQQTVNLELDGNYFAFSLHDGMSWTTYWGELGQAPVSKTTSWLT
jgi:hypothetical protein